MKPGLPFFRAGRTAVSTLLALGLGLGGWQALTAQTVPGHNSSAPVNYAADRIELLGRQDRVVLSGNVSVSQGELRVSAARTIVDFSQAGSLQIQRITATGGVVVTRSNQVARGDVAVYDFNRRIITMVGNASLRRGSDTLNANRFVIDLASGASSAEGGRVSGSFAPPKRN
jgi:lipopolysaccharide export system protein LptA